ncbi:MULTISPECIES: hypothetical protein [unclassified Flavobacterium]|uniref:hypothetical protein n=1 Tax=unclassified Flavobacterium TaxID=196869 RepID=UPI001570B705|nr:MULTISPECIES: hypothetical protein [unclassified Flavobacterium]NRT13630.1 hypothetical protein [Flavobacterium sp. 14A]NRT15761.1 hypothetical protein [Flavobacterium sp. 28A]
MKTFFIIILAFSLQITFSQKTDPCVEYIPCNIQNPDKYIFIGKKIDINRLSQPNYCNDYIPHSKYKSKYEILKKISKNIDFEIADCVLYDHSIKVKYYEFENLLLFVAKGCDELNTYRYEPVYRMKNGNWASPIFYEHSNTIRKSNKEPHKVDMAEPIIISRYQSGGKLEDTFPEPYFEIKQGKVYMKYGFYPEDLITN